MSGNRKTYCAGSNSEPIETRPGYIEDDVLGKCGTCGRILKVAPSGRLRRHSVRGRNTASHDKTMGTAWDYAPMKEQKREQKPIQTNATILTPMTPRPTMSARSKLRFPSLSNKPSCPWHEDCTPMDCENFRTLPASPYATTSEGGRP